MFPNELSIKIETFNLSKFRNSHNKVHLIELEQMGVTFKIPKQYRNTSQS